MENIIRTENLSKVYGCKKSEIQNLLMGERSKQEVFKNTGATVALKNVSINIKRGEIFVIIGLSGSGKSTLLRCLNMLEKPSAGDVWIYDKHINDLDKKGILELRRNKISMVFQDFGLLSHRNVLENIAFGLEIRGVSKRSREEKAHEIMNMVGLNGMEKQPVSSLSGGMKQRVGIARALCSDTEIMLMDEPFSALDPLTRREMQFELYEIQKKMKKTIIFITHDMNEAFKLGYTIAVMKDGEILQVDKAWNIANNPATDYVRNLVSGVEKSHVLQVKDVRNELENEIHQKDSASYTIRLMKDLGVTSFCSIKGPRIQRDNI